MEDRASRDGRDRAPNRPGRARERGGPRGRPSGHRPATTSGASQHLPADRCPLLEGGPDHVPRGQGSEHESSRTAISKSAQGASYGVDLQDEAGRSGVSGPGQYRAPRPFHRRPSLCDGAVSGDAFIHRERMESYRRRKLTNDDEPRDFLLGFEGTAAYVVRIRLGKSIQGRC